MTNQIEYEPRARGACITLIVMAPLVVILVPAFFLHYLALVVFLGGWLRAILENSGLDGLWNNTSARVEARWDRKFLYQRAGEIEKRLARESCHKSSFRDQRLPKSW